MDVLLERDDQLPGSSDSHSQFFMDSFLLTELLTESPLENNVSDSTTDYERLTFTVRTAIEVFRNIT